MLHVPLFLSYSNRVLQVVQKGELEKGKDTIFLNKQNLHIII